MLLLLASNDRSSFLALQGRCRVGEKSPRAESWSLSCAVDCSRLLHNDSRPAFWGEHNRLPTQQMELTSQSGQSTQPTQLMLPRFLFRMNRVVYIVINNTTPIVPKASVAGRDTRAATAPLQ